MILGIGAGRTLFHFVQFYLRDIRKSPIQSLDLRTKHRLDLFGSEDEPERRLDDPV